MTMRPDRLDTLARLAEARGWAGDANPFRNALLAAERDEEVGLAVPDDAGERRAMAERAEARALEAEREREDKRKPYEADPLFMYLWRRRYGTPDYGATGFTRRMDRWVARLIGFEQARANYHVLLALPDRLHAHAARLRAEDSEVSPSELARDEARLIGEAREAPTPESDAILAELDPNPVATAR